MNGGNRGAFMEAIKDKFPKIYESKYKNTIIQCLKEGQSPYSIAIWLKENTDCKDDCISESTIRRFKTYLISIGEIEQKETPEKIYAPKDEDLTKEIHDSAGKELLPRIKNLSDGNLIQLFLGTGKLIQNMDIISNNTENLSELINDNTKAMLNDRANRSS